MDLQRLSDEELIARFRMTAGSPQGALWIDELFRRHYDKVARWCYRSAGNREQAADLAQDIFSKAFRHLDSFQGAAKFSTWLFTIARNETINAVRFKAARPEISSADLPFELPDPLAADPLDQLQKEHAAELVRQLLNENLDETEKQVFTLHYGEDWPLDTITRFMGLSNPSGAKAYIVSAKRKLGRAVDRWKAREARS